MKNKILILIALLLAFPAYASDSEEQVLFGMNLSETNAIQAQFCSLKPGKSKKDYERSFEDYINWSKENGVELMSFRLDPLFAQARTANGESFEWIDLLISNYETTGAGWTKWLGTPEGQKLNEKWQSAADCRVTINQMITKYVDPSALASDDRVISFRACTPLEGVTAEKLAEKHAEMAEELKKDSSVAAWNVVIPGLGTGQPQGFLHMVSYASPAELMARQNRFANEGGWKNYREYTTQYAACSEPNVYVAKVRNRP